MLKLRNLRLSVRLASSVSVDKRGVATITIDNGKVNMMDRVLMPELVGNVRNLVADGAKGFIIRSDKKNIFCAGLDISQMHQKPIEEVVDFWKLLEDSWHTLYSLEQPMIAAVNGAAIAGGCLIACCADKRIMTNNPKTRIGYSAPMLGMVTPTFVMETFETIVGRREAELALGLAKLYSPQQAYDAGLIDVLVDSDEELLEEANRSIEEFLRVPAKARNITKKIIRGPLIQKFESTRDEITKFGVEQLQDPVTQEIMGKYLANLGKKK